MTDRQAFPVAVFPDVLSFDGHTYLACAQPGVGLVVYRWPDGRPAAWAHLWTDRRVTSSAFARLTQFDGRVFVAYCRDDGERGCVVANAETGNLVVEWRIPVNGIQTQCWGPGGLLAVQDASQRVLVGQWPDQPVDGPLSRPGAADGLSRFDGDRIVLKNEENEPGAIDPVWSQFNTAVVGKSQLGGVAMRIGDKSGVLWPGDITEDPRVTEESSTGRFTVAYWTRGSQGALPLQVACDIGPEDLAEAPIDIAPYGRPVPHAVYFVYNADRELGDYPDAALHAVVCLTPTDVAKANARNQRVLAGAGGIELAKQPGLVYVSADDRSLGTLKEEVRKAYPVAVRLGLGMAVYKDGAWAPEDFPELQLPKGTICAVKAYRDPDEPNDRFVRRILDQIVLCVNAGFRVALVEGMDDRNLALSEATLLETAAGYPEFIRTVDWIVLVIIFSYGRSKMENGKPVPPGGAVNYPRVWAYAKASAAASAEPDWQALRLADVQPPKPTPTPIPTPTPQPPAPIPTPIPTPEELAMMTPDEREKALKTAGPLAAKFWNISPAEGEQGCREYNDALRNSGGPEKGIEGDPTDWIVGAGCRAKGATLAERQAIADLTVRLRR